MNRRDLLKAAVVLPIAGLPSSLPNESIPVGENWPYYPTFGFSEKLLAARQVELDGQIISRSTALAVVRAHSKLVTWASPSSNLQHLRALIAESKAQS